MSPEIVYVGGLLIMFVATIGYQWLSAKLKKDIPVMIDELKTQVGTDRWNQIMSACEMAIHVAQQLRLNEAIEDTGMAAKAYAMKAAQRFLDEQGITGVDIKAIDDMIEALYNVVKDTLKESAPELDTEEVTAKSPAPSYFPGLNKTSVPSAA